MKIKQLDIAGFRSLKQVSWQPGDLNVVIGQNGTGKSNLLRMLELIAASAQGRLSKHIQNAGGMSAILWDGVATSIQIGLETCLPEYKYEFRLAQMGRSSSYAINWEMLTSIQLHEDGLESSALNLIERTEPVVDLPPGPPFRYVSSEETVLSSPFMQDVSNSGRLPIGEQLCQVVVYHDLNVGQDSKIRQAVVTRFEKQVEPDGQNLVPVLHTLYTGDREFKRSIDSAMRAAFGAEYEELVFPPAADQRVQLRLRWKTLRREQSAADLSDGTLRFLLLMTILTAPDPPMLIAIDEPETGLHPSMLPIIAEFAVEASSRTQVVFTTHSPQFLDAFTDTKPTTTVAKWENGETSLHVLSDEELAYWLREYSLGELFRAGDLEAIA